MSENSGEIGTGSSGPEPAKGPQRSGTKTPDQEHPRAVSRIPVVRALVRGGAWTRSDVLAAITVVVAVVAIIVPMLGSGSSGAAAGPDLTVDAVQIALASKINAVDQVPGKSAPQNDKATGSAIDVTLRNSGTEPALIVKAVFSFTHISELYSCPGGAGAVVTSASYDLTVPITAKATARNPLVLGRDMRFAVSPNSIDRFRISVGPSAYADTSWPWIYEFNLALVEDNGHRLDLGSMSTLGFSHSSTDPRSWDPFHDTTLNQLATTGQLACATHDAAELTHAMETPGLHSPELRMMYREAERLTTY